MKCNVGWEGLHANGRAGEDERIWLADSAGDERWEKMLRKGSVLLI